MTNNAYGETTVSTRTAEILTHCSDDLRMPDGKRIVHVFSSTPSLEIL
jgi:hypothetical protein